MGFEWSNSVGTGPWEEWGESTAASVAAQMHSSNAVGDFDLVSSDILVAGSNHLDAEPMRGPQEYAFMAATNQRVRELMPTVRAASVPLEQLGLVEFLK